MVYLRNWEDEKSASPASPDYCGRWSRLPRSDVDVAPSPTLSLVKPPVARRA
jgi:hypothetical protein